MRAVLALFVLLLSLPAIAQTITPGEVKVLEIFYVKEGAASPYQGLLQMTPAEYAAISAADKRTRQIGQFNAWKVERDRVRPAQSVPEKVQMVIAMWAQVDELNARIAELVAHPGVAAQLPPRN